MFSSRVGTGPVAGRAAGAQFGQKKKCIEASMEVLNKFYFAVGEAQMFEMAQRGILPLIASFAHA